MNMGIVRAFVFACCLLTAAQVAWAGQFRTKIITASDDPLVHAGHNSLGKNPRTLISTR